ncbi:MAG: hypothetical protein OHK005_05680 [Candidatus Methylacidiphilales bacterium]
MILTVSIIVLMLGFLFLTIRTLGLESRLQSDVQELSDLARGTRFRAITDRVPWRIEFRDREILSLPPLSTGVDEVTSARAIQLESGVDLLLRASSDQVWEAPKDKVWRFDPTGVVGPMQFRIAREGAYVEVEVDPLTGRFLETARFLR